MTVSTTKKPSCVLDQSIVNEDTIGKMTDLGLSFFAPLCGRNRGAFVLDPSDGHTWGCTAFPDNFAELAGVNASVALKDANAIKELFVGGNVTAAETVALLDYFVKMVYHSSPNVEKDPYACNAGGLTRLQCDPVNSLKTVKSVTLAGLLVPAPWATGGKPLTLKQARKFYTATDFEEMRELGLNTVQVPVPISAFMEDSMDGPDVQDFLENHLLPMIQDADLQAILELQGEDNDDAVAAAAHFAVHPAIFALTVTSKQTLRAARAAETALKIFVPVTQGDLAFLDFPDENTFGALNLGHSTTVGDVASSTSQDDRMKLFYHENVACISRSPLEYAACFRRVPLYVANGFDLSIDDCINKDSPSFIDYGQCDRFDETIDSPWWHRHRRSFAARQLASYEQGMGWSFATWKLYGTEQAGFIDEPAKLLSLQDVAAANLLPALDKKANRACLNAPISDFVLGDKTLAPTPGPPPDCGNGWWNASINDCTYWVPPTTPPPAPVNITSNITSLLNATIPASETSNTAIMAKAGGVGVLVGFLLALLGLKVFGRGQREGYSEIPN